MSTHDFDDLPTYRDLKAVEWHTPSDQVGSLSAHREALAMRVRLDAKGIPVFVGEEHVDLYALEYTVGPHSWWRLELRARSDRAPTPTAADQLVLGSYPWTGSAVFVPFRKGRKRHVDERYLDYVTDDWAETVRAIENLPFEPFQSDSDRVVAGVSSPELSEDIEHRKTRFVRYVFGVVRADQREAVVAHLLDEAMTDFVPLARSGSLVNPYNHGHYAAIKDDDLLAQFAEEAVSLALAGPEREARRERLEGGPVSRLVEDVFRRKVSTWLKHESGAGKRRREQLEALVRETPDADLAAWPVEGGADAILEMLEAHMANKGFRRQLAEYLAGTVA